MGSQNISLNQIKSKKTNLLPSAFECNMLSNNVKNKGSKAVGVGASKSNLTPGSIINNLPKRPPTLHKNNIYEASNGILKWLNTQWIPTTQQGNKVILGNFKTFQPQYHNQSLKKSQISGRVQLIMGFSCF